MTKIINQLNESDIFIELQFCLKCILYVWFQAPHELSKSYEKLCKYLAKPEFDEIEIVRAIMVWISCQRIRTRLYPASLSPQTPIGYMKMIKHNTGTFAALFTQICR